MNCVLNSSDKVYFEFKEERTMLVKQKLVFILTICLLVYSQTALAAEAHPLIVVFSIVIVPLLFIGLIIFLFVYAACGGFDKKDKK